MRPTVSLARRWQPEALLTLAQDCDDMARELSDLVAAAVANAQRSSDFWMGAAAEAARQRAHRIDAQADAVARDLVLASAAARDGAAQLAAARNTALADVDRAEQDGFLVSDDGSVTAGPDPVPLLVLLAGGREAVAQDLLGSTAAA